MSQENELARLESFVHKILEKYNALKEENSKLIEELDAKQDHIQHLQSNLSTKDVERGEISTRVNKLVEQIEQWEMTLDTDDVKKEVEVQTFDETAEDAGESDDPGTSDGSYEFAQGDELEEDETVSAVEEDFDEDSVEDTTEEEQSEEGEEGRVQHNLFSMSGSD